ncbi:uncharacterized protein LOC18438424 [Amborella trichopoda]|uniref:FCP1 homology domain-containing protein n=1 Tax=Amborella trichopoda TaxID=13333 RepID=W1PRC5_AMBTC|nr:uncharacterized protein LOC18438424 [Amborella trichopoda]ERN10251.1 hypothetical protein AMTR_s01848p00007330 [Amborella trichopoda]|eukprot:XP_020525674.1 uncharacterized protein LOC18438424 [Amborella trichopoda]
MLSFNWVLIVSCSKILCSLYACKCAGRRKPEPDAYLEVLQHLAVDPASCVFIDDRETNVEAAINTGMNGIHFKGAMVLEQELLELGIETGGLEPRTRTDVSSLSEKDTRT